MAMTHQPKRMAGIGQLSLVEHALCPLDSRISLVENSVFESSYSYFARPHVRTTAQVRLFCRVGLAAKDEITLWGLLALTLMQREPEAELLATPHWCLRQLRIIDQRARRGGRQYRAFADSLRRLSAVTYMNDGFYDPRRSEHRKVTFHFLSYSLPVDPRSTRAWHIVWDPLFFAMVRASAGHFRFDLETYRELDPATRRLFLFVSKVLSRRSQLHALRLEQVAVDLIGFSRNLAQRDMKVKVSRCLRRLVDRGVLAEAAVFRRGSGSDFVRMTRGGYFTERHHRAPSLPANDSPLFEPLQALGFEADAATRLIRRYPQRVLAEWLDITQAAAERFGPGFFKRSPMAYLVDSVRHAAAGSRSAPDWWLELKKGENRRDEMSRESKEVFARLRCELFGGEPSQPLHPTKRSGFSRPAEVISGR